MDQESKVRLIELIKNLLVLWQPNHKSYTNILILSDIFFYFSDYVITLSHQCYNSPALRPADRPVDICRTNAGHIYEHQTQPRTVRRTVPSCEHHIMG